MKMGLRSLICKMTTIILSVMGIIVMISVNANAEITVITPATPAEQRVLGDVNDSVMVTTKNGDEEYGNVDAHIGNINTGERTTGLIVEANNEKSADVTAKNVTGNGNSYGVKISNGSYNGVVGGTASVSIDGNASGIYDAVEIKTYQGTSSFEITGDVIGDYRGVYVENKNNSTSSLKIGGDVTSSLYGAIDVETGTDSTSDITVGGDVKGGEHAISVKREEKGTTSFNVGGDVSAAVAGISIEGYDSDAPNDGTVNIRVEGTIDGKIGVRTSDNNSENVTVTAWRIMPNEVGAVAGYYEDNNINREFFEATEFEKKINYIIKVEQPAAGATLSASHETAHEGDKVTLNINVGSGWTITGAYNGLGEKVELFRDENGNYFVIVPRGGGVYLSVTTFAPERPVTKFEENIEKGASICASIAQMITEAAQGATVRVTITSGSSLCKTAVDALEARPDVTLVVDYAYNGGMYEATIPGGASRPDLKQYKNAAGGIDFETLNAHFGGKQIY